MFIDSHCHLDFDELYTDLQGVVDRAHTNQVYKMISIGTRSQSFVKIQSIAEKFENIFFSVGVHPCEVKDHPNPMNDVRPFINHPKMVAIGETGLDYYYSKEDRDIQIKSFEEHIDLSIQLKKPLIIHTRDADEDTVSILKKSGEAFGVFHCFTGSEELAFKALDLGFYISFSGILTFKNAQNLRDICKKIPLEKILIETDSPYLAPVPHRGKSNEPSWVVHVAETIASIQEKPLKEVATVTSNNATKLFKL